MRELIGIRRARPAADLITDLIEVADAGDRLNEDQIVCTVIVLLNAGHEATVNTLGIVMRALLTHPDQWLSIVGDEGDEVEPATAVDGFDVSRGESTTSVSVAACRSVSAPRWPGWKLAVALSQSHVVVPGPTLAAQPECQPYFVIGGLRAREHALTRRHSLLVINARPVALPVCRRNLYPNSGAAVRVPRDTRCPPIGRRERWCSPGCH